MTTQTVQVFIRSEELGGANPLVIACYPESRPVPIDTHGPGMSVLMLPVEAIQQPSLDGGVPKLVDNWQDFGGTTAVSSEAARRIEQSFTASEQIASNRQMIEYIQKYGADTAKWPPDARQHKAELDEKWKYVDAVKVQARAHITARPHDPSSDKVWPTRPST